MNGSAAALVALSLTVEYDKQRFVHFTHCSSPGLFLRRFYELEEQYLDEPTIFDIAPVLGIWNVDNLQRRPFLNMRFNRFFSVVLFFQCRALMSISMSNMRHKGK